MPNSRNIRTRDRAGAARREELVMTFHPSWKGMFGWYAKWMTLAVAVAVGTLFLCTNNVISVWMLLLIWFIAFGAILGTGRLIREATTYRITTRRVSQTSGILNKKTESAFFDEITNTTVEQSLWERMLGIGRVDFDTAGERLITKELEARGHSRDDSNFLSWWGCKSPHHIEATVDGLRFGDDELGFDGDEEDEDEAPRGHRVRVDELAQD